MGSSKEATPKSAMDTEPLPPWRQKARPTCAPRAQLDGQAQQLQLMQQQQQKRAAAFRESAPKKITLRSSTVAERATDTARRLVQEDAEEEAEDSSAAAAAVGAATAAAATEEQIVLTRIALGEAEWLRLQAQARPSATRDWFAMQARALEQRAAAAAGASAAAAVAKAVAHGSGSSSSSSHRPPIRLAIPPPQADRMRNAIIKMRNAVAAEAPVWEAMPVTRLRLRAELRRGRRTADAEDATTEADNAGWTPQDQEDAEEAIARLNVEEEERALSQDCEELQRTASPKSAARSSTASP